LLALEPAILKFMGCFIFICIWMFFSLIGTLMVDNSVVGVILGFVATLIFGFYVTKDD